MPCISISVSDMRCFETVKSKTTRLYKIRRLRIRSICLLKQLVESHILNGKNTRNYKEAFNSTFSSAQRLVL